MRPHPPAPLLLVSIPFRYAENGSGGGDIYVYIGFQFLLGTLKTKRAGTWLFFLIAVSIPFRYAENDPRTPTADRGPPVSIPFRYAENGRIYLFIL